MKRSKRIGVQKINPTVFKNFRGVLLVLSLVCLASFVHAREVVFPFSKWWEPSGLSVFRRAYPDMEFIASYDREENDWLVHVVKDAPNGRKVEAALYWCGGRFLPKEKLSSAQEYRRMLYRYSPKVPDPEKFTEDDIRRIKDFSSPENRREGPVDPPFLYNFIYGGGRAEIEANIERTDFLGFSVNVHKRIVPVLKKVEERINALAQTDELKKFKDSLDRIDCYNWRSVRDTENRSFHSLGIALDVLPRGYYQKSIYWGWQRQWDPESWWKTPLSKRWSPPQAVIDSFIAEGFVWGGSWIVWDNMHFEYRPELLKR